MSRDQLHDETPLRGFDDLTAYFARGSKGAAMLGVGTEHEKFGFDRATLSPLRFEGAHGIEALLRQLAARYGWSPIFDGEALIALEKNGAAVTLEPGGQLELSGRIVSRIEETEVELRSHLSEVAELGGRLGQRWALFGMHPWHDTSEVGWVPKSRYGVMRDYMGKQGRLAHWMMKMTCTVQANFDYRTEDDAMEMLRLSCTLNPLVTALFACSPYKLGAATHEVSSRMAVWQETDPRRCGTPPALLSPEARFSDYAEWLLDVPMLFVRREGRYIDWTGRSFRRHLAGEYELSPTLGDWELHLSTAFPDVRMKSYIETRTADCAPLPWLLALPALWKGLFYAQSARRNAFALLPDATPESVAELARIARTEGLSGTFRGQSLRDLATNLVAIAADGLDEQTDHRPSEARYLAPLLGPNGEAYAPAERLEAIWRATDGDREAVTEAFSIDRWL